MQLEYKYIKKDENEIQILINICENDIKSKIYFLDNEYIENNIKKSSHNNLKELNEFNTELYIKKEIKKKKKNIKNILYLKKKEYII